MQVNDLLIDDLAKLSRLSFDEQEKEDIKKDLQQMITFIEKLGELNVEGVEPLRHMSGNVNALRDDVVQGSVSRAEGLLNAPDADDTFFRVPKVIRK